MDLICLCRSSKRAFHLQFCLFNLIFCFFSFLLFLRKLTNCSVFRHPEACFDPFFLCNLSSDIEWFVLEFGDHFVLFLLVSVELRHLLLVLGCQGFCNSHFDLVELFNFGDHLILLLSRLFYFLPFLLCFQSFFFLLDLFVLLHKVLVDAILAENVAM